MPKRIDITDDIKAKVIANMGSEPTWEQIAVFEMTAVTSLPLSKKWSIFDQAQITAQTFEEAATYLNAGGYVPFHTLHNQGYEIPVGRVFYGEAQKNIKGFDELRVLAFIDLTAHEDLANKIDNGVVEEVSVGMSFKQLLCSACGDDLMSDESKLWNQTCANGHVIGMGNHHLKPNGLGQFRELSAVSKGASNGAKILGIQKRTLAADFGKPELALVASIKSPEFMLFTQHANLDSEPVLGEDPVVIAELQAKLTNAEAKSAEVQAKLTAAEAKAAQIEESAAIVTTKLADAETALATTQAQVDTLEAAKNELEAAKVELEAAKATAEAQLAEAQAKVKVFEDAETAKLSQRPFRIPLGGVAGLNAAHSDADKPKTTAVGASSAFKTPKRN